MCGAAFRIFLAINSIQANIFHANKFGLREDTQDACASHLCLLVCRRVPKYPVALTKNCKGGTTCQRDKCQCIHAPFRLQETENERKAAKGRLARKQDPEVHDLFSPRRLLSTDACELIGATTDRNGALSVAPMFHHILFVWNVRCLFRVARLFVGDNVTKMCRE